LTENVILPLPGCGRGVEARRPVGQSLPIKRTCRSCPRPSLGNDTRLRRRRWYGPGAVC
jgi:hypothetical protein